MLGNSNSSSSRRVVVVVLVAPGTRHLGVFNNYYSTGASSNYNEYELACRVPGVWHQEVDLVIVL